MIYVSRRLIITCLLLLIACVMAGVWGLRSGAVTLETSQVFAALMGDTPRSMTMVVTEWRLPRVLMALLIGAALGVSGAIFQSLMRNPLGSPDVMGFNTGAWSGVLVAMVLFGQDLTAIALAAMVGGIVTSLLVWLLAWRNGIDTFRLIIIGIGVRAMLVAFNTAVAESVFRNGANSGFVECRIAQWPDVGKNLAFRTHHYINVNCRRLAGAANALAGNGR